MATYHCNECQTVFTANIHVIEEFDEALTIIFCVVCSSDKITQVPEPEKTGE